MTAIFKCSNCGFHAVFEQEDNLEQCPECEDIHVDVTYGVPLHISSWKPGKYKLVHDKNHDNS